MIRDLRATPNHLTLLRLLFIPLILVFIVDDRYQWAFALFLLAGLTDGLDGVLARVLHQRTVLGQYLDPIADKLLLSSTFLMLSVVHKIPWRITVVVFSRDLIILLVCALLYSTTTIRDFSPSIFGKANTLAQIFAVVFVFLTQFTGVPWVETTKDALLWTTFGLTIVSGVHYVLRVARRLSESGSVAPG